MQSGSTVFGNDEEDKKVPSFLLILLCARAYDDFSVRKTYPETLAAWFGYLAHVTGNNEDVIFNDYIKKHENPDGDWLVLDPMDDSNNIVGNWSKTKINEIADWFQFARDKMIQAIRHDQEGDDQKSLDCLIELFGNSISNQCKNA